MAKSKAKAPAAEAPAATAPAEATPAAPAAKAEKKYRVNFAVSIPDMGHFSKEDLEENPEACAYLVEIGSPAVTEL